MNKEKELGFILCQLTSLLNELKGLEELPPSNNIKLPKTFWDLYSDETVRYVNDKIEYASKNMEYAIDYIKAAIEAL